MNFLEKKIIILILIYKCYSYAVFPFKIFNKCDISQNKYINNKILSDLFIKNCLTNKIYSEVNIGIPKQTINFFFSMKGSSFYLFEGYCPYEITTFYDFKKSTTFQNSSYCTNNFNRISSICNIKEKITFYNNINLLSNISLNDSNIAFGKGLPNNKNSIENNVCGYIGFSLMSKDISNLLHRFLLLLKFFNIIKEYTWTFHFFDKKNKNDLYYKINNNKILNDNYEGLFIIGIAPHIYDNQNFNETYYKSILSENRGYLHTWDIKFFEIYFYDENNSKIKMNNFYQGGFDIETNYIISTKEYFNLIKEKYFNKYIYKNICTIEIIEAEKDYYNINYNYYEIISCNINNFKEKEMKQFPDLNFFHLKYNYTFVFNYKELFKNYNNRIFFLILTSKSNENFWTFGKLFMKKYQFIFDTDKKTISFYIQRKKNNFNSSKYNYFVIFLIAIIFSVVIGIYIGKIIFMRKKKIVNELHDDYEYKSVDTKNEKFNQNIEMKSKIYI